MCQRRIDFKRGCGESVGERKLKRKKLDCILSPWSCNTAGAKPLHFDQWWQRLHAREETEEDAAWQICFYPGLEKASNLLFPGPGQAMHVLRGKRTKGVDM